jgi:hypothetical protein
VLSPSAATCISICSCLSRPEVGYAIQVHDLGTGKEVTWNTQYKMIVEAKVLDGAVDPSRVVALRNSTVSSAVGVGVVGGAGLQAAVGAAGAKSIQAGPALAIGGATKGATPGPGAAAAGGGGAPAAAGAPVQQQLQQSPPNPERQGLLPGLMLNAGRYLVTMQLNSSSITPGRAALSSAEAGAGQHSSESGAADCREVPLCWQVQVLTSADEKVGRAGHERFCYSIACCQRNI